MLALNVFMQLYAYVCAYNLSACYVHVTGFRNSPTILTQVDTIWAAPYDTDRVMPHS